ncbi:MAG: cupin domain-containing protein [Chloroflexi bacterium]|nr:cupin domain-containing protein [Chloroflexota bacterium]
MIPTSTTQPISIPRAEKFDPVRHVSQLLHDSEKSRVVLFCFEPGQALSPHESTSEVVFYAVEGKPTVQIGEQRVSLEAKSLVVCPSLVPHGVEAGGERAVVLAVITPRPG